MPKASASVPEARQPRDFKDRALRWIAGLLPGARVPLVPDAPRLLRVLDSKLYGMAPTQQETDRTFLADDGGIWTFEFQFREGETDVARMAGYHLLLVQAHQGHAVHSVIFWGQRQPSARILQVHEVTFAPHQVFLQALVAEEELRRWRRRWEAGPLPREAAMELAMLPLMRHGLRMRELVEEALPLAEGLEEDLRTPVRAAMLCLGYGELETPAEREWARRGLLGMPVVGQELFEDLVRDGLEKGRQEGRQEGRREGRHEGELRQAREYLLKVFTLRLGAVPDAVQQAVAAADDLQRLNRWFELVACATDAAAAERAIRRQ